MTVISERLEHRVAIRGEIRQIGEDSKRQFEARVCNYDVPDEYGTVWAPGCFSDSLRSKLPKCVWGHDWLDPIGKVIEFRDSPEGLDVTVQLDEFDAVPRARQAWTQLRSGSIDEFSFGFLRQEWTVIEDSPGEQERMVRAQLDEVSPVLVGAVPGTKPLAVRSSDSEPTVSINRATEIAQRLSEGKIGIEAALAELEGKEVVFLKEEKPDETPKEPDEVPEEPDAELAILKAEMAEALAFAQMTE